MGPRIQIKPDEFIEIAKNSQNLIIKCGKSSFIRAAIQYVLREGDYYYYTVSKEPLDLPSTCKIKEVDNIL